MFDPDSDNSFAQTKEAKNYAKFYRQWVRNNFKSKAEGREVGEEQDFILIICPGQPKTEVRRKASDADKHLYAQEWAAYLAGKEQQQSGTPIELLPGLPNGMADALKSLYIYTIEQMATLPDVAMQKVGMGGNEIRQKAKAYLAKGSAELDALRAQLAQANATIVAQVEEIERLKAPKPKGRPRKTESAPVLLS